MLCLSRNLHVELHKVLCLSGTLRIKVHKALYLSRNLHVEVHKVLRLPRSLRVEVHQVLYLPRNLHFEVYKALRLPRNLHFEVHQVLCLPRNLHNFPPCFATGGEYFAAPVTYGFSAGADISGIAGRVLAKESGKCALQGSPSAAPAPATKSENEPHVQKSRFTAPVTTMSKVPRLPRKLHFDVKQLKVEFEARKREFSLRKVTFVRGNAHDTTTRARSLEAPARGTQTL